MAGKEGITNISLVGENHSVAVTSHPTAGHRLPVFVTPLAQKQVPNQLSSSLEKRKENQPTKQKKVLLKAVSKKGPKSDSKIFCLRNITLSSINELKRVIREEFSDDITSKEFDVGYLQGSAIVRIRNREDIAELHSLLVKPETNVSLWCDGLRSSKKHARSDTEDDTDDDLPKSKKVRKKSSKETVERDKEVQNYVEKLRQKHGSKYSQMQFRIWGEMKAGGLHTSLDDLPTTSMFVRAGGGAKKTEQSPVVKAVTDAATAITSVITDGHQKPFSGSPAKRIENRTKLYRQLSELKNLKDEGVLSDEEYCEEKKAIMEFLKEINPRK